MRYVTPFFLSVAIPNDVTDAELRLGDWNDERDWKAWDHDAASMNHNAYHYACSKRFTVVETYLWWVPGITTTSSSLTRMRAELST